MKKIIQIALVTILTITTVNAQSIDWNWANGKGGSGKDRAESVVVDASGNSYVLGNFDSPTISFGSVVLTNSNPSITNPTSDFFLLKYNTSGTLVWARKYGNSGNDIATSITIDNTGIPYITGYFDSGILQIPNSNSKTPISLNFTNGSAFIIKFDGNGRAFWAKNYNAALVSATSAKGLSIKINGTGHLYVAGVMETGVNTSSTVNIFLAKFNNSNGNLLWESFGTGLNSYPLERASVDVDAGGNAYITGNFENEIRFGNALLNPTILSLIGAIPYNQEMYLVKYNNTGTPQWAKRIYNNNGGYVTGLSVVVDQAGTNLYVSGSGSSYGPGDYIIFEPQVIGFQTGVFYNYNNRNNFIAKFNATTGITNWVIDNLSGINDELGDHSLSTNSVGNIYSVGNDSNNKISIYNSLGANIKNWKSNSSSTFKSIFVTPNNDIYTAGYYSGGLIQLGTISLPVATNEDLFVAKIGPCNLPLPPSFTAVQSCFFKEKYVFRLIATPSNPVNYGITYWYATATSTTPLAAGTYITPPIPVGTIKDYYAEVVNGCGVSTRIKVTIVSKLCPEEPLPIDEAKIISKSENNNLVEIYPNPSNGVFNLNINEIENVTIEVYNQLGVRVKSLELENDTSNYQLDLSGFAKGIYILNISNENQKLIKKLIIE
jgi:Secretion system C-terminal sorting domain/Ig-like domain CHU_C associated